MEVFEKEQGFYMVYVEGQRGPTFKHDTKAGALTEAKRLARETGWKTYVLCSVESVEFDVFKYKQALPNDVDDLPF